MAENMLRGIPMNFEPKRNNRFVCEFPTELGIEVWKVQKFTKPKLNINKVAIKYMNQENYVAGSYNFDEITITFLDTIGPSTTTQVSEWFHLHAEELTGRMGYAEGYKKTLLLKGLDPMGNIVEKWTLEDCQIVKIDFGEYSHDDDGVATVTVTVQPWRCVQNY